VPGYYRNIESAVHLQKTCGVTRPSAARGGGAMARRFA